MSIQIEFYSKLVSKNKYKHTATVDVFSKTYKSSICSEQKTPHRKERNALVDSIHAQIGIDRMPDIEYTTDHEANDYHGFPVDRWRHTAQSRKYDLVVIQYSDNQVMSEEIECELESSFYRVVGRQALLFGFNKD